MSSTEPNRGTAGRHATPYVRQRPAHRSVEPIDDLAQEPDEAGYVTHDSDFTVPGGAISGRAYRRSRAEGAQLRRDLHYGQYLEIPKGRRDIIASRERPYSKIANFSTEESVSYLLNVLFSCYFARDYEKNLETKLVGGRALEEDRLAALKEISER